MLNHWIRSLSVRLWLTSIAALAACLTALAMLTIYAFNHYPEQMLGRHEQVESAAFVEKGLVFDNAGRLVSVRFPEREAWLREVLPTELKYRVLDAQGHVLLPSADAKNGEPWVAGDVSAAAGETLRVLLDGRAFDIFTLRAQRGNVVYYVQTATSTRFVSAVIGEKVKPIPAIVRITLLTVAIIFGLTLTFSLRRLLRPLREASRAAAQITPRNLKTRLSVEGMPSEIEPLIHAFNDALGRLENGFSVQQQFLASAAHELQTPLTLIRGQIELQPGIEQKDLLFREIDLMARQVRQLLHLAEVSESQNFTFGTVSSAEVAQDVVSYLGRKADRLNVKLQLDIPDGLSSIWADRSALFILLKNIVENAINVSPANGVVVLKLDEASIEVRDQGPGIRQEYIPLLFKRFWRAPDAAHDGAGLGLAICKEISIAHEWRLTVSSLASGTSFKVWI